MTVNLDRLSKWDKELIPSKCQIISVTTARTTLHTKYTLHGQVQEVVLGWISPVALAGTLMYCRFGNFRDYFIFANSIKRHTSDVKNSRLRHDIHKRQSDFAISRGFIFTKLRICEVSRNKVLAKISEFYSKQGSKRYKKVIWMY